MISATPPSSRLTLLLAAQSGSLPSGNGVNWLETVAQLLGPQGVETIIARSGYEALELVASRSVHVAVLDQQMPQVGGLQVIRMMRDRHASSAPPAILLAENLNGPLMQEALLQNVFSVLPKPVDYSALLDAIARAVRRFHQSHWPVSAVPVERSTGEN